MTVTTPEDIGSLTASILCEPELANQVVFIAGDTLTYRQLADTVDQVLNRKVERVEWTVPALQADLAAAPNDPIRKYRTVFAEGKGVAWAKGATYNARRAIETIDVKQWIDSVCFDVSRRILNGLGYELLSALKQVQQLARWD